MQCSTVIDKQLIFILYHKLMSILLGISVIKPEKKSMVSDLLGVIPLKHAISSAFDINLICKTSQHKHLSRAVRRYGSSSGVVTLPLDLKNRPYNL